jgi:hypothetical protein
MVAVQVALCDDYVVGVNQIGFPRSQAPAWERTLSGKLQLPDRRTRTKQSFEDKRVTKPELGDEEGGMKIAQRFNAGKPVATTARVPSGTADAFFRPLRDLVLLADDGPSHKWPGYFQASARTKARHRGAMNRRQPWVQSRSQTCPFGNAAFRLETVFHCGPAARARANLLWRLRLRRRGSGRWRLSRSC